MSEFCSVEEMARFSITLCGSKLPTLQAVQTFAIIDYFTNERVGKLLLEISESSSTNQVDPIFASKRKPSNSVYPINGNAKSAKKFSTSVMAVQKDVGSFMKDLNIIPDIPNDLQCVMCPYKATMKANLKRHVQLKHLGGVGISATCTMCEQKFATRGSLKRHMMSAHNLNSEQASKLMS